MPNEMERKVHPLKAGGEQADGSREDTERIEAAPASKRPRPVIAGALSVRLICAAIGLVAVLLLTRWYYRSISLELQNVPQIMAQKLETLSALRIHFLKSIEAEKLAVMAETDEASQAFADESRRAAERVDAELQELSGLIGREPAAGELKLFKEFEITWAQVRKIDQVILDLAAQNTNLKAFRLSFGQGREALERFEGSLNALTRDVTDVQLIRAAPALHGGWVCCRSAEDRRLSVVKKAVLIVDDETNIRLTFSETMAQMGFDARTASNGAEALAKMQGTEFALALLDLRMPGMDGIEVLHRIREVCPRVRVIMISAHGTIGSAVEAMKLGAVDFIQKPCTPDEIRGLVAKVMEREAIDEPTAEDYPALMELCKRKVTEHRLDEARNVVQKALSRDPGRPEAYNLLGAFHECRGEWAEAQKYYRAALEIDSGFKPARANLERTASLHKTGKVELWR